MTQGNSNLFCQRSGESDSVNHSLIWEKEHLELVLIRIWFLFKFSPVFPIKSFNFKFINSITMDDSPLILEDSGLIHCMSLLYKSQYSLLSLDKLSASLWIPGIFPQEFVDLSKDLAPPFYLICWMFNNYILLVPIMLFSINIFPNLNHLPLILSIDATLIIGS